MVTEPPAQPSPSPTQPPTRAPTEVPPRLVSGNARFTGRSWALQAIDEWLAAGTSLLVLTGDPGTGKSALAAWLVGAGPPPSQSEAADALARLRGRWNAVHFCALQWERGSADPRQFAEKLALQLAEVQGFTAAALEALAPLVTVNQTVSATDSVVTGIGHLTLKGSDTLEVFRTCVVAPLTRVMERRQGLGVAILVDGLDEAMSMPDRTVTVTDLLRSLLGVPGVHLLIGTRRETDILNALDDGSGLVRYLDLSSEEAHSASEGDLRSYVAARLASTGHGDAESAVEDVVRAAEGNFAYAVYLLDEVAAGAREVTDLYGLPRTLNGLYDASLARLQEKSEDAWAQDYQPLLGLVTVACKAAPTPALAAWSGVDDEGVLTQRLADLRPVVRYDDALDGWRLFHRSMADFLATREIPRHGSLDSNQWFVSPVRWHQVIAEHYLNAADVAGSWEAVDDYGVRNVLQHLERAVVLALEAGGPRLEADQLLDRITGLLRSPEFHAAQQARARGDNPYARDLRACVMLLLVHRPLQATLEVVEVLARDPRPPVRAIAVETLVRAHGTGQKETRDLLARQLHGGPTERGVALNAMRFLGPGAVDLFVDVASSPDEEVRRATAIALYLLWRAGPDNVTHEVMNRIIERVRPSASRSSRSKLEFLSDLSIAVYANHCELDEVTRSTSDLWRTTLKDRLHLGLVNQPILEPLLKAVVSSAFSRRIAETAWLADPSSGPQALNVPPEDAARVKRVLPALEPGSDPETVEADLGALLASPIPLLRVTAAMVLNVHAHVHLEKTAELANRLFDQGSGEARLWTLLGFTTRLPQATAGWTEVVEKLTLRLLREEPGVFTAPGVGALEGFDITLMPLGTAYAQAGLPDFPVVAGILDGTAGAYDLSTRRRVVECLGPVGMAHPDRVLAALGPVLGQRDAELEASLVRCLSIVRVAHPETVDQALAAGELQDLRELVVAATDVQSVWRYVWWLGLYKNAVHQSLHYGQMRRQLLQGGLLALVEARSARKFLSTYTSVVLRMVREADYELIRWTRD
jgi:hypothetical protein